MTYIERLLFFTLIGLLITLAASVFLIAKGVSFILFIQYMSLLLVTGFVCRILRRKLFFGADHTWHQALSFEALFQGIIALNPHLPYPSVEQAFIRRQTDIDVQKIQRWFLVRPTSAFALTAALIGAICIAGGSFWTGIVFWAFTAAVVAYAAFSIYFDTHDIVQSLRFVMAVAMGVLAVACEAWFWLATAHLIAHNVPTWELLVLYLVTLTLFEISPIPLGLGLIELAALIILLTFGLPLSLLALPLAYRLFRSAPIICLTLFYLPRYKLALVDIYDPHLELALSKAWHQSRDFSLEDDTRPVLSIVIPAYNEALRLPQFLNTVIDYSKTVPHSTEIIVVDDGSHDGTVDYVQSLLPAVPNLQLLVQPENQGKGAAVRRGVLAAQGQFILFTDADGSTPIGEAEKLLATAEEGADVVIASRRLKDSLEDRSFFRGLLGSVFYRLTNLMAVPGIADTQCGFKLFPRDSAMRLFSSLHENGWAFDVELLYLAQKLGMTIEEVPVQWTAVAGSKVNPIQDAIKMLGALIRIRKRWKGIAGL